MLIARAQPQQDIAPRVLIVDPDPDTRELYRQRLRGGDWTIIEAVDGRDAIVAALKHRPTLVITNMRLPFVDGFGLCEVLRADPETRHTRVLAIAGPLSAKDTMRTRRLRIDVVLPQPTDVTAVLAAAQRLCAASTVAAAPGGEASAPACKSPVNARVGKRLAAFHRYVTTTPPQTPPEVWCPGCMAWLVYKMSRIGGVSSRNAEQWDEFFCEGGCGSFEYRHRTRRLRTIASVTRPRRL